MLAALSYGNARDTKLLLLKLLLWKLECVVGRRQMALDLVVVLIRQLLLWRDHSQVDVLLVSGSDLLLLLLEYLDLLCKCELLHWTVSVGGMMKDGREPTHERGHLRRTTSVCDVKTSAARPGLTLLIHVDEAYYPEPCTNVSRSSSLLSLFQRFFELAAQQAAGRSR